MRIVPEPGADPDEVDRLGRRLRAELAEFDVDDVTAAPSGPVPAGSKGADLATVTELIVTLSASGGVLATVVAGVKDWLQRRSEAQRVVVTLGGDTLTLERASTAERAELISAFVERHSA